MYRDLSPSNVGVCFLQLSLILVKIITHFMQTSKQQVHDFYVFMKMATGIFWNTIWEFSDFPYEYTANN